MENSLFHKEAPKDRDPTPLEMIEPEIVHLKKGYSIRHGAKSPKRAPYWILIIGFCWLAWLYLMDPVLHAWYKGDAIQAYLYLHNYGTGSMTKDLVESQILTTDDIQSLNRQQGSYQDYYASPQAAQQQAEEIATYMKNVRLLQNGDYKPLDPIGRMRYALFIYTGLVLPTQWSALDPVVPQ